MTPRDGKMVHETGDQAQEASRVTEERRFVVHNEVQQLNQSADAPDEARRTASAGWAAVVRP